MSELWIVQPYVPRYRVPFFEQLFVALERDGIVARVVAAIPDGEQAARGDAAAPPWLTSVEGRTVRIAGASVVLTNTRSHWARADGVIVPHMGTSLDAYSALMGPGRRGRRVGVWGHIRSYVALPNRIDAALEAWQLRRADEVFAYTPGGADFAIGVGAEPERVTTVMNAVDTGAIQHALDALSDADTAAFLREHRLDPNRTFAYIGGLDESKRIDMLAEVLELLWRHAPDIRLLVGGRGAQRDLLQPAVARNQVVMLGYVDAGKKALISRASRAIVSPGRIGLIAVEALAMQRLVITTRWRYHAPEIEYLQEPGSVLFSDDDPAALAKLVIDVASQPLEPYPRDVMVPGLDDMVSRFRQGVVRMMS